MASAARCSSVGFPALLSAGLTDAPVSVKPDIRFSCWIKVSGFALMDLFPNSREAGALETRPTEILDSARLSEPYYLMNDYISIQGPVERVGDELMLRIPLSAGGAELALLARGIGQIEGDVLCVVIQPWLAELLRVGEGSLVIVDNKNGKFTITRSADNDNVSS